MLRVEPRTGELVWRPRAHSIAWSGDGSAIALLVGEDGDDLELRSWPERELLAECEVKPWACCNTYVALSPDGDRAAGWEHFELLGRPRSFSKDEIVLEPEFGEAVRFVRRDSGAR